MGRPPETTGIRIDITHLPTEPDNHRHCQWLSDAESPQECTRVGLFLVNDTACCAGHVDREARSIAVLYADAVIEALGDEAPAS